MLKEFSKRLQGCVRTTDMVARLGGDEFVVILEGLHGLAEAEQVALNILLAMEQPIDLASGPMQVSSSIGIACYSGGAGSAAQLLAQADEALYAAKRSGRNTYRAAAASLLQS